MATDDSGSAFVELDAGTAGLRIRPAPAQGWLRSVRDALGWPRRVVAKKLGVSPEAVRDYEGAEVSGAISVATLRRYARALGCDVVVALVPSDASSFAELTGRPGEKRRTRREIEAGAVATAGSREQARSHEDGVEDGDLEAHLK